MHTSKRFIAVAACLVTFSSAFVAPGSQTSHRVHRRDTTNQFSLESLKQPNEQEEKTLDEDSRNVVDSYDPFKLSNGDSDVIAEPASVSDIVDKGNDDDMSIWAARGLLLVVAMLWGTNFASVKYLETLCFHPPCNHPPSEAALARFGVAALVSMPLLIGQRLDVIVAGLECGIWISLGYITQAMALQYIPSGTCAFICSLTVVVVPLISAVFFGKPIKPINVASAAVALTGVGVLEGLVDVQSMLGAQPALAEPVAAVTAAEPIVSGALSSPTFLTSLASSLGVSQGDLLALGQPIGFGLSFMRIEHYVEKFEDVDNRVLTIAAAECVAVGLCSLLWVLYDFHGTIPDFGYMMDWHRLVAVGWTGIMTTVVAIYLEGFALQVASATDAALTFASEPVWASLFGAWLLKERLDTPSYIGGGVILLACVLGALGDLAPSPAVDEQIEEDITT